MPKCQVASREKRRLDFGLSLRQPRHDRLAIIQRQTGDNVGVHLTGHPEGFVCGFKRAQRLTRVKQESQHLETVDPVQHGDYLRHSRPLFNDERSGVGLFVGVVVCAVACKNKSRPAITRTRNNCTLLGLITDYQTPLVDLTGANEKPRSPTRCDPKLTAGTDIVCELP